MASEKVSTNKFSTEKMASVLEAKPEQDNAPRSAGTIKRYEVTKPSSVSSRRLEIARDGGPYLATKVHCKIFQTTTMTVHTGNENGAVVAGARFPWLSSRCEIVLGDPDQAGVQIYTDVKHDSMWSSAWSFDAVNGKRLMFKVTHNKDLGSSRWASDNFKLVDSAEPDKVLMVFIHRRSWGFSRTVGYIDFFVELGDELELQAITAIVAILHRVEESQQSANASTASSASAAATAAAV